MTLKGVVRAGGLKAVGGGLPPNTDALVEQNIIPLMGRPVPSNANGKNGNFYFRTEHRARPTSSASKSSRRVRA